MPDDIQLPITEDVESGWSTDQWWNMVRGLNESVYGVRQALEEVKEGMGITPAGSAAYFTQETNKEREMLQQETSSAGALPGAGFTEFVGEAVPYGLFPLGRGVKSAAAIGAGLGGTIYHPDAEQSRLGEIATGGLLGGVLGKLFARPYAKQVADEVDQISRSKSLVPYNDITGQQSKLTMKIPDMSHRPGQQMVPYRGMHAYRQAVEEGLTQKKLPPPKSFNKNQMVPVADTLPIGKGLRSVNPTQHAGDVGRRVVVEKAYLQNAQKKIADYNKKIDDAFNKMEKELAKEPTPTRAQRIEQKLNELQKDKIAAGVAAKRLKEMEDAAPLPDEALENIPSDKIKGKLGKNKLGRGQLGKKQAGEVDPALAATIAGAGVGAVAGGSLGDGSPTAVAAGALTGALGGRGLANYLQKGGLREASRAAGKLNSEVNTLKDLGTVGKEKVAELLRSGTKVLDDFLGAVDTRIEMLSPDIAAALRNTEFRTHQIANQWISEAEPFFKKLSRSNLTDEQFGKLKRRLLNDRSTAISYLRGIGHNALADDLVKVGDTLDDVAKYLKDNGLGDSLVENYFPRQVIDTTQFETVPEVKTYLEHLANQKGLSLTDFEKQDAITSLLNGALRTKGSTEAYTKAAQNLKHRMKKFVTVKTTDSYADPHQAFNNYVEEVVKHVETQKFFSGRGVKDSLKPQSSNLSDVATKLSRALTENGMPVETAEEIVDLLKMRFGPGEMAPHRGVQNFKNYTYTGLLGNPIAAITQLGDLALSAHKNGLVNTSTALVKVLAERGKPMSNGLDKQTLLGLRDAAQDFASNVKSRDVLNWALDKSLFRSMDRLGKNTFINAAMAKNAKLPQDEFISRWKPWFGDEVGKLYDDVQKFNKTGLTNDNKDNIGLMLWNSLSEAQPISLSTLPKKYLQHPNGRMAYMLQSFTLRMFNIMRQDIKHQIDAKNYGTALKNTLKLGMFFTLMNGSTDALKDFVLGKDMKGVDEYLTNNAIKLTGANKYTFGLAERQGVGGALLQTLGPPTAIFDTFGDAKKAVAFIPIGGRFIKEAME